MENTDKKGFVESLVEFFKGVSDEAKALKIQRKSSSLIKMAISSMENDILVQEDKIDTAKENLEKAIFNNGKTDFEDGEYVDNILTLRNSLTTSEEELEATKKTLAYLKELLETVKN